MQSLFIVDFALVLSIKPSLLLSSLDGSGTLLYPVLLTVSSHS